MINSWNDKLSFLLKKRQDEWQVMFMISACIYLAGGLFYTLFASAEPEVWSENTAALNDTVEPNEKRT